MPYDEVTGLYYPLYNVHVQPVKKEKPRFRLVFIAYNPHVSFLPYTGYYLQPLNMLAWLYVRFDHGGLIQIKH